MENLEQIKKEEQELSNFYREEKERIKSRKKALKQQLELQKAKDKLHQESLWRRIGRKLDRGVLGVYQVFENKAADLRYKVENYDHWEADQIFNDAAKFLNKLEDRVGSSKKLTMKHFEKATLYKLAVQIIDTKKLGYNYTESDLADILRRYDNVIEKIKSGNPEVLKQLQEDKGSLSEINKVLDELLTA